MYVYRLLRPDENFAQGLSAKNPASNVSVFDHVLTGSWGPQSRYISTCADLNALNVHFVPFAQNPGNVVMINTDMLQPNQMIDLRQPMQRGQYIPPIANQESIDKFNNYANKFQEILLVGVIPANCIQLVQ